MEANRVTDIAKEYDVNYINFLDMNLVDYMTDCYDPDSHLNPSGARKVTDYLGKYISSYYEVVDHREDATYSSWHDDYDDYRNFKAENLKNQSALDVYLMLLADKNYDVFIEIRDSVILKNEHYLALFENLGIDCKQIWKYTDGIFVQEAGRHIDMLDHFGAGTGTYQTSIGKVKCMHREDGGRSVYSGDKLLYSVAADQDETIDLRIVVFEKDSMQMVDQVGFTLQGKDDIASDYIAITGVTR